MALPWGLQQQGMQGMGLPPQEEQLLMQVQQQPEQQGGGNVEVVSDAGAPSKASSLPPNDWVSSGMCLH
jgi:hypothetical protein